MSGYSDLHYVCSCCGARSDTITPTGPAVALDWVKVETRQDVEPMHSRRVGDLCPDCWKEIKKW